MTKIHYLREWREYRGYTLKEVVESMPVELGKRPLAAMSLSRMERDEQSCTIKQLRAFAQVLTTTPGALIERDPNDPTEDIASLYKQLNDDQKRMVIGMINAALDKA